MTWLCDIFTFAYLILSMVHVWTERQKYNCACCDIGSVADGCSWRTREQNTMSHMHCCRITQCTMSHIVEGPHSAQTIWHSDKTQCHRLRTLRNRPRSVTVIEIYLKSVCRASIFQHQDYDINEDNKGILPLFCSDMSLSATVPTMKDAMVIFWKKCFPTWAEDRLDQYFLIKAKVWRFPQIGNQSTVSLQKYKLVLKERKLKGRHRV